jgi:hypothetical protein
VLDRRDRQGGGDVLAGLLRLEVGDGGPVLHAADPVDRTGREQERLDQRRLAGATMPDNQDVTDMVRGVAFHRMRALPHSRCPWGA